MEQKNLILAIVLSMGFLFIWSAVVTPRLSPRPAPATITEPAALPPTVVSAAPAVQIKSAHTRKGQEVASTEQVLRDGQNEVVVSARGGAIRHWRMRPKGEEIDLVLDAAADPLPLASFPDTVFRLTPKGRSMVMEATLDQGLRVVKTLTLAQEGHLHSLSYRFVNPTGQPLELKKWEWGWGPGLGTVQSEQKENESVIRALSMNKLRVTHVKEDESHELGRWAGIDNRYFLVAFLPKDPASATLKAVGKKGSTRLWISETTRVPARGDVTLQYDLYVGPKGYTQLKAYNRGLEESVDFGWFTSVGHLLLRSIYALQRMSGNYGIAIILVTLVLNILLLPLTLKSFKATMSMKKLQPKIADLQQRFKGDPKRLNVEMMNLYKNSGANPFGGCLPMILQIPIFVAFFNTLRNAYELRGAPFMFWIKDLASPDKLPGLPVIHVLPLVMGGVMFLQQRMAGAVTDPTQRQLMYIMPVMFTFMLYSMPSGLVIYWLTNSLVMIVFQYIFNKTHEKKQEGSPQAPLIERR